MIDRNPEGNKDEQRWRKPRGQMQTRTQECVRLVQPLKISKDSSLTVECEVQDNSYPRILSNSHKKA